MKRNILPFGVFFMIFISACSSSKQTKPSEEKFPVTTPIVIDTVYNKEYVADIQAIQTVELRARVKGFLDKIHVDEGQIVTQGQMLFSISNREYQEELLKANALLKCAIADSKAAELEVKNNKILVEKNVISRTQLEMAQVKLDALLAKSG